MKITFVMSFIGLALLVGVASGQWSTPAPISPDDQSGVSPSLCSIGGQGLQAVWLEEHDPGLNLVRGSRFDGSSWGPVRDFSPASEITVGPATVSNPAHDSVMISYYLGSVPTDDDTWGVYTVMANSDGTRPPVRICDAPGLGIADLRMAKNGNGQPGIVYMTGCMMSTPGYIEFISRPDSEWSDSLRVASGFEYPPYYLDVGQPRVCGGPGDTFFLVNTAYVNNQGAITNTVHIEVFPPDTAIGTFAGQDPEVVYNPAEGRLYIAYRATLPADTFFGVRTYAPSEGWSDLQVIDSNWTSSYSSQISLTTDNQGYIWLVYANGTGASRTIQARYCWAGWWSDPESIASDSQAQCPVIATDATDRIWVAWYRSGYPYSRIFTAYREFRPGIRTSAVATPSFLELEVSPNPCRDRADIGYQLPARGSRPGIRISDRSGRLVRTLDISHSASLTPHYLTWDCRDQTGARVPAGCFFVTVKAGNRMLQRKVVVSD